MHKCTFALILTVVFAVVAHADPIRLIHEGASDYVIFHESPAPQSVVHAANELRTYLQRATGAALPIVHQPRQKMICLGDNAASRRAGFNASDMPWEGFQIATKDSNVYLVGRDTTDSQHTPGGGNSAETFNASCQFLEQFVGVRWLIPGEHGDYVPKASDVTIPDTDYHDAPAMFNRRVPYTQENRPEVKQWWQRQRLGGSLYLNHGHNWRRTIPASHFEKHPEWFAERGGRRVPPTGRYKLCTTNAGLIQAYADATIDYFDRNPNVTCYSLSPSDSAGYCQCEHCSALYEQDPNGKLSVTPAILTFYNEVARLVAKKCPHKVLAGYAYASYLFPPKQPIKLEPNVFIALAPSFDYGFTLARPALRKQWQELLEHWTEVTENISYYDLPVNIATEAGALNPPGLEILKFIYPQLESADVKGVYVYGVSAWGRGAPLNYLLAKLAWNPNADVETLFDEFCAKAYGAGGDDINHMFRLLDREVARHFREFPNASYTLTNDMMRDIYAKNFPEIERRYRSAQTLVSDLDAKARLEMIGDNLTVLHWNLCQNGLLDHPEKSKFYKTDADFFQFLSANQGSLALQPNDLTNSPDYLKTKRIVTVPPMSTHVGPVQSFRLRGDQHLIVRPDGKSPAEITVSNLKARGQLVTYRIYDSRGGEVSSGVVRDGSTLPVGDSATDADYYHFVISGDTASFSIRVRDAAWAVDGNLSDQGLHLLGSSTPLYFFVAEGTASFQLSLEASPPGETAAAELLDPNGREIAKFDCSSISVDRQKIDVAKGQLGWWRFDVHKTDTGVIDDVWIKLASPMSGYFSIDPSHALDVR